jgi:hypothetical protein
MRLSGGDSEGWRSAVREGNILLLQQLLKQGDDVNHIDEVGKSFYF